jgi:rSAM/selenodomain-associated transferase 1
MKRWFRHGTPADYRYPQARLLIMSRAPLAGQVKTRLIPALGAERAARLHARLLELTAVEMLGARLCPVTLCCTPDTEHPAFRRLARYGANLAPQAGGDLGERMEHALAEALRSTQCAIVIGTDCPLLDADLIEQSIAALTQDCDAVLGPAEDGGYYLLGVRRSDSRLFRDIAWGSATVLRQTRERLAALGYRWLELRMLWDVDRPEDLERLASSMEVNSEAL